jgi:hypothetical protein
MMMRTNGRDGDDSAERGYQDVVQAARTRTYPTGAREARAMVGDNQCLVLIKINNIHMVETLFD